MFARSQDKFDFLHHVSFPSDSAGEEHHHREDVEAQLGVAREELERLAVQNWQLQEDMSSSESWMFDLVESMKRDIVGWQTSLLYTQSAHDEVLSEAQTLRLERDAALAEAGCALAEEGLGAQGRNIVMAVCEAIKPLSGSSDILGRLTGLSDRVQSAIRTAYFLGAHIFVVACHIPGCF